MGKPQRDEHDGHRVDGAEDGHRDGQDGVQPGDGNKEADHREDDHPGPVGDFGPLQAEVFAAAAEQTDAGVQAGDHEDQAEQGGARRAVHPAHQVGEHARAVGIIVEAAAAHRADVSQRRVDHKQHRTGDPARADGVAHHRFFIGHAPVLDVQRDDDAEVQGGNGVHGLVAVHKALGHHVAGVVAAGHTVAAGGVHKAACHHNEDQHQQDGPQRLAQPVGKLFRLEGHQHGHREEDKGVNAQHPKGSVWPEGAHRHFKGGAGGAGDGKPRPDGNIDEQGEQPGELFAHPACQHRQPAGLGHRHHAQNGQADGADGKADHGGPGIGARLRAQKGRKDQIARAEKHGKQGQAHKEAVPFG